MVIDRSGYAYDVFISYSLADQKWVWERLLPRLEMAELKVIIDERDFQPGAPILDERARAVQQSRKTVLVLSPDYRASEWSQFESLLVQTLDPGAVKRRLVPVVHRPCRLNLRIRPLVSVDLTTDDDRQWQRLLRALDPCRPEVANPVQRLSVAIADASPVEGAPGWHTVGSAWMAAAVLGLVLLVGLTYLLLYDWPILRSTVSVMAGALVSLLGLLGLREDRDFFQRLSHFVGQKRSPQAGMAAVLVVGLVLWSGVGWPRLRERVGVGTHRFAIDEWESSRPGVSLYEREWTQGTRRILYMKLSQINDLSGIFLDDENPAIPEEVRRNLDLWISGDFGRISDDVQLTADIVGRRGEYLQPVSVHSTVDEQRPRQEVMSRIKELQDRLACEILEVLAGHGVTEASSDICETLTAIPTNNVQALQLNNEAVIAFAQGDSLERAESLLREALALDPSYADAHNNLGRLLRAQGDLDGAIAEYKRASQLLPRYPIYRFNLGLAYDRAGDLDSAASAYELALDLDPYYVRALNNLAFVYLEKGELDQAFGLLRRGLDLDPGAAYLHKNLGRVYLEQGRTVDAINELTQAVELSEDPYAEAMFFLAQAYADAGQVDSACVMLSEYAQVAEDDAADDPGRPAAANALATELRCP